MYHPINATVGFMFQPWNSATIVPVPPLPQILSEWASVIPLVCHLASYKRDYELVGQLALSGRLSVDIFPRLGVLYGLSKLLKRGAEFIDQASTQRSPSWTVWDVCWGSVFPCANGGASAMIIRHMIRLGRPGEDMPDTLPSPVREPEMNQSLAKTSSPTSKQVPSRSASATSSSSGDTLLNEQLPKPQKVTKPDSSSPPTAQAQQPTKKKQSEIPKGHRRMQTLHVLQFSKLVQRRSCVSTLDTFMSSTIWHVIFSIFSLGATATLIAFGLYGTAVILASGTIAKVNCKLIKIERPPGYLQSNETEKQSFMVMGLHQNTCTWYLFTGDRGIVDSLLNKSMVMIKCSSMSEMLAWLLQSTHTIQLIATTYVAGSKGWDGVALVVLMVLNALGRWTSDEYFMVKRWMEAEGIAIKSKSFNFTGRTMLLGAIQDISRSQCVSWMNNVISPHPRREAWLARLHLLGREGAQGSEEVLHNASGRWSEHDWKCILLSSELAHMSAEVLRKEFPGMEHA